MRSSPVQSNLCSLKLALSTVVGNKVWFIVVFWQLRELVAFPASFNWGGPERLVTSVVLTLLTYPNYIDFIIKHQKQEHNAAKTTTTTRRIRIVLLTEHCFHQGKQLIHVSAKCSCSSCVPYSGLQSRRIDSFFVSAPVSWVHWRLRS